MSSTNKEAVYDEHIYPLMAQIIAICKQHRIAMVASFAIPTEQDASLRCTSSLLTEEYDPPDDFKRALGAVLHRWVGRGVPACAITVTSPPVRPQ